MDMTETQLSQVRRITIPSKGSKFQKKGHTESNGSIEKGQGGQGRDEEKLLSGDVKDEKRSRQKEGNSILVRCQSLTSGMNSAAEGGRQHPERRCGGHQGRDYEGPWDPVFLSTDIF